MEMALEVALSEGKSASELSREIRHLLKNPDILFRRVKDKHGNLVLSKEVQELHTGRGIYRSSYKNAVRLASNEINVAYKTADLLRIQQNPDIVGYEIVLSKQHKVYDVCDELKGKYPKNFQFAGWHIQCKCQLKPILKSQSELIAELKNDLELPAESSKNYVSDVPENFKKWTIENKERIKNWKTQPDWWENNKGFLPFGVENKIKSILDIPEKNTYIAFEPFSPIIINKLNELNNNKKKQKLLAEIVNAPEAKILFETENNKVVLFDKHKGVKKDSWQNTLQMAKALSKNKKM
ncbi:hypothetical protein [Capnocytophaga catalasegens]|uniref:Uncharacterized protein n=1 Tax=Capnocytophaga catalasegens TaxID=1004260 RepID=A0AAV5ATV9_9FLAO|nr:hypothetical protein [Capnocytophaga catalasegens]GIZ14135.1 hypothetical protein RCZ03_01360 [Capnocytophaga catalasegens]GJM49929.1 hypothetical protein RCZ15_09040 [Capnocytophaga catalasegens]GJM51700.1 hypothetical protein RCZ16_00180 [Capnocytophaga catalasegens]